MGILLWLLSLAVGKADSVHIFLDVRASENAITQFKLQCLAAQLPLQFLKTVLELESLFSAVWGGCSPYLPGSPFGFSKTGKKCPSMAKSSFHILDHKNFLSNQRRAEGQEPLEILLAFVLNFPFGKEWASKEAVCRYSGRQCTRLMTQLIGYDKGQICSKYSSLRAKEKDHIAPSSNFV